jgi:hypothetical protein
MNRSNINKSNMNKSNMNKNNNKPLENKNALDTLTDFFNIKKRMNNNALRTMGIGEKVNNIVEGEFSSLTLVILLTLLALLVFYLYKNTFSKLSQKTKTKVDYYKKLDKINPNINVCGELEETEQYRLCDYYISSSYNTACIGKPHFDYVDEEMYAKVLNSGARYIQLPICSRTVKYDTEPVVATAERGKNLITSLNTLELRKVLSIIRSNAFKYVKNVDVNPTNGKDVVALASSNYPLILHLEINTNNIEVMNQVADALHEMLGNYILSPSKYRYYPISLEKLCNLSNKIIVISTPGYKTSNLTDIVIPTDFCFRTLTIADIEERNKDGLNQDQLEDYFSRNVSYISQKNSYKNLEIIKNNLDTLLQQGENSNSDKSSKMLENLFNNNSVAYGSGKKQTFKNLTGEDDLFTMYNMIGLTLIEPMTQDETITNNPNPYVAFTSGCQLIPMNFHLNDDNMNTYINVFSKSSFVLKPSGLRLGLREQDVEDIIDKYGLVGSNVDKLDIIPDFLYKYSNEYITLQEQASGSEMLMSSLVGGIITFIKPKLDSKGVLQEITTKNVFKVVPSPLSNRNDCVMLVNNDELAVTVASDFKNMDNNISLQPVSKSIADLRYQTFYPEVGLILKKQGLLDQQTKVKYYVSFRLYNEILEGGVSSSTKKKSNTSNTSSTTNQEETKLQNTYYLAFEKNKLRVLNKMDENNKLCSFSYDCIKSNKIIQLSNPVLGGIVVNERSGIVYSDKNKKLNTAYKFKYENYNGSLVSDKMPKSFSAIILYISDDRMITTSNNSIEVTDSKSITGDNILLIGKENVKDDDYIIMNNNGNILGLNKNQSLEFMNEKNINLSGSKYFEVKYSF